MLNQQYLLKQLLHTQHPNAAFGLVSERVQFFPAVLLEQRFHFLEIPRNLGLEKPQNALHHGIIALEHLLQVIEVVVIRRHGQRGPPSESPRIYAMQP